MRKTVCLKSTLRRPVVALFLLLLIGTISFAFISRAVEYVIVERENTRVLGYYTAVGTLSGDSENIGAAIDLLEQSQYVAYQDYRRYTSGLLTGMANGDTGGGGVRIGGDLYPRATGGTAVVVYATVSEINLKNKAGKPGVLSGSADIYVEIDTVLAGYPDTVSPGRTIVLEYTGDDEEQMRAQIGGLEVGGRYLFYANSSWPVHKNYRNRFTINPLYGEGPYFWNVGEGEADFSREGLREVKELFELAGTNQRLLKVTATKNMSAMPNVALSSQMYTLSRGRWLTYEDQLAGKPVCVIEGGFARVRGLSVGDTITLSFADFPATFFGYILDAPDWVRTQTPPEQYAANSRYMPWNTWFEDWEDTYDWENWQDWRQSLVSEPIEFEIVGTYYKKRGYTLIGTHDTSLVFIPDSALPAGYGEREPGDVPALQHSFVLKSAVDRQAFMLEMSAPLARLGFTAHFLENNIDSFISTMTLTRQSAAFNAAVFAAVLVLALALSVFIYMRLHRREFAILRALGETKRAAAWQMTAPLLVIGLCAIAAGGYFSWDYSLYRAQRTLSFIKMPDGIWRPMGTLPIVWLYAVAAAVLLLLCAFALAGAAVVARKPALELLQGGHTRKIRPPKRAAAQEDACDFTVSAPLVLSRAQSATGKPRLGAGVRHIWRHIVRAPLKSSLSVLVALFFVLALGWMGGAIDSNAARIDELYRTARLEGRIKNSIGGGEQIILNKRTATMLAKSEHVSELYLELEISGGSIEGGGREYFLGDGAVLCGASKIEVFFPESSGGISVEYAGGFSDDIFGRELKKGEAVPVLLPAGFVRQTALTPGSEATLSNGVQTIEIVIAGQFEVSAAPGSNTPALIAPLHMLTALEQGLDEVLYSAARAISNSDYNRDIFTSEWEIGRILTYNQGMNTFCTFNATELENAVKPLEKNLRLLGVLYPVTIVVSALIGCGLALLLMLQSAREAAVMRVLGADTLRVRLMLCAQQTALCLFGLAGGLAVLLAAAGGTGAKALMCAALYLASSAIGSGVSSAVISGKMPLELLQVKE